jgi:hypothetical protein
MSTCQHRLLHNKGIFVSLRKPSSKKTSPWRWKVSGLFVGRLVVVIDVNPSHGFWTRRLMKLFGHEGK